MMVTSDPHAVMLSCPTSNFTAVSPGSHPAQHNPTLAACCIPPQVPAVAQAAPCTLCCQTPPLLGVTLSGGSCLQVNSSPAVRAARHRARHPRAANVLWADLQSPKRAGAAARRRGAHGGEAQGGAQSILSNLRGQDPTWMTVREWKG